MKQLLYLFLAITVACSSGDDDSSEPQTFLERYDGIVWKLSVIDEYGNVLDLAKKTFSNETPGFTFYDYDDEGDFDGDYCFDFVFGQSIQIQGENEIMDVIVTIHSENEDNLTTLTELSSATEDDEFYTTYTVINNGETLLETTDYNQNTWVISPNESPCN